MGVGVGWVVPAENHSLVSCPFLDNLFLPILSMVSDLCSSFCCSPETLMDTKWVTSELAWTSHPESGVSLPHRLPSVLVAS